MTYRYSATITMHMETADRILPLSHVGPESVILEDPASVPEGPATIVVVVDGRETRRSVLVVGTEGDVVQIRQGGQGQ